MTMSSAEAALVAEVATEAAAVTMSSAEVALHDGGGGDGGSGGGGTGDGDELREVATEASEGATPTATAASPSRALACG